MSVFSSKSKVKPTNTNFTNEKGNDTFFGIQAKLNIGKSNDKYEAEADKVADKVVADKQTKNTDSFFSPNPVVQSKLAQEVQKKDKIDETEEIQEKPLVESITPVVQLQSEEEPIQEKCGDCEQKEEVQKKEIQKEEIQKKEHQNIQRKEGSVEFPTVPKDVNKEKEKEDEEVASEEIPLEEEKKPVAAEMPSDKPPGLSDLPMPPKKKKKEEEKEIPIQTKKDYSDSNASNGQTEQTLNASKGKGSTMSSATQQEMNSGFGTNFSNVKIHTDSSAVQMNKDLGAQAFTHGNDIYFNEGKYNPESESGKHLLAHELTHTVQQGASGDSIQRLSIPEKTGQPEGRPEKPNDGAVVEGKSNSKIDNDENVKNQDDLDEDEIAEKKDPPRDEVHVEKGAVQGEGVSTPPVDRGGEAAAKISEQKEQMNEQLSAEAPAAEGESAGGEAAPESNLGKADAAEQGAQAAIQKAASVPIPEKPEPFKHPEILAPKDSDGKELPRQGTIDTQVRGLAYIAEMLREKGYEMKQDAAEKTTHSYGLDGSLETSRKDLALSTEGTQKTEDQNTERKDISETSKKALDESKQRQAFVSTEAPTLAQEADSGKSESSELASEAGSKASQSKSEIPDDEDARADAEQQSGEMDQTAQEAQSMDDAISQTGDRARQYIQDAEQASKDNQLAEADITENDSIVTQIDGRVAEMKGLNAQSQASIDNSSGGPELIRKHAQKTAESGDELIAATIVMESELNALQEEYISGMAAIEPIEKANERVKKEQEEKQNQEATPEELQLYTLAALPEKEQEEHIQTLKPEEKTGLMAALDKMITTTPDDGTQETEGKRLEVKLSSGESGPTDPRQAEIDKVNNQRVTRLGGVMNIADQNMTFLTVEQKKMLAQKLVAESITDDIKNISVLQMAKGMLEGMINPLSALDGVVGGFEKTFSGVANIFNADAWAKDPLGNLLQIGADISTGLAMVFSSILGIAGMITALMVALTIISWGTLSWMTVPVIGWMGTVMTYAGWGAIIAGSLSVYFNTLAYIKNLNDAGTAATASELFGNAEQMKKNASDGFTGAMAVVEGIGAVKMGPVMKSGKFIEGIPTSPGAFAKQTLNGAKEGLESIAKMPAKAIAGAKKLFAGGKKGLTSFKKKIQGFFTKGSKIDADLPPSKKKGFQTDEGVVNKGKTPDGHEIKVDKDGNIAKCSDCKVYEVSHKDVLDSNPELKAELKKIREKMIKNPDSPEAMKELEALEKKLDDAKLKTPDATAPDATTPKTDAPDGSTPKTDTPEADKPKTDAPDGSTPKTDTPDTDKPKTDAPDGSTPKTDTPDADKPKTDAPDGSKPKTDTPEADKPKMDPPSTKTKTDPPMAKTKKHRDFEAEIRKKLDAGEIDIDTAKKLQDYSDSTKFGPKRKIDDAVDDLKFNNKEMNPETKRFGDKEGGKVTIDDATRKKVQSKVETAGADKTPDPETPEGKKLKENKDAIRKKIKEKEAEIDALSDPKNNSPEARKYRKERAESFERRRPEAEHRKAFEEKYDQINGGDLNDPNYIKQREKAFKKDRHRSRMEHTADYDTGAKNAKKGDAMEDARIEQQNKELEEQLGRPLTDDEKVKKRSPGKTEDQFTFTDENGREITVSPDLVTPSGFTEIKSGRLSLTPEVEEQIMRYAQLAQQTGKRVTYELLEGASESVLEAFKKYGIDYIDLSKFD